MGSNTEPKPSHPIVHLSGDPEALKQGSKQWKLAGQEIREALDKHGYFLVKYDAISNDDRESALGGLRGLFDLPVETKRRASRYRGGFSFIPIYEAVTVVDIESFTRLMRPEGNDEFRDALSAMSDKLSCLTRVLTNMLLDSFGLGQHQETFAETSNVPFTMNKYSVPGREQPDLGLQEHADPGYLTVLGQNDVAGLTVKTRGGDWVVVDPGESHFVVFIGHCLRALTNGRLHATVHRVTVGGAKDRYSFGSFLSPKPEHTVDALPGMVTDDCPRQFRPFLYGEFSTSVVGGVDVLRTFAGV